ncbi:hypothetical protein SOVF_180330 [Spinacia oleracea]|nr:hypothetical protein SOVF_180330 [Spinacia oleracea]
MALCSLPNSKQKSTIMKQTKAVPLNIPSALLFLCLFTLLTKYATAEDQVTYLQTNCSEDHHYDQGSEYQNNLGLLFSNLNSEASTNKFYNFSIGDAPNKVYGLFLCHRNYVNQVCQDCITLAQGEIQRRCPSSTEAIVWYTECMFRYANHSIISRNDVSVFYNLGSGPKKYDQFNQQLTNTYISLFNQATAGNSSMMSATTVVYVAREISVGCYVDCTPDLSPQVCRRCLGTALGRFHPDGYQAGVLLQPSCRLMYAFYDAVLLKPGKELFIALGVVSAVAAASLFLNVFVCLKRKKASGKLTGIEEIESMENLHFELDTIKAATDDFSPANKIGQGGFGIVYLAWRLWDEEGTPLKLLDSALGSDFRKGEAERCIQVGLLCIQEDPAKRPNIESVLLMLNTEPITLPPPVAPPAFPFHPGKRAPPCGSYSNQAECEITELAPR